LLYLSTKSGEIDLTQYCGRPARPIRPAQDLWPLSVGMARDDFANDSALEFDPGRRSEVGSPLTIEEISIEKLWESDKRAVVMVPRALCLAEDLNNSSAPISNVEPVDLKELLEEEAERKSAARKRKEEREAEKGASEAEEAKEPKSGSKKNESDSLRLVIDPKNAPKWIKSLITGNQGSVDDWAVMDSNNPIVKEMQLRVGDNPTLDQVRTEHSLRKRRERSTKRSDEPTDRKLDKILEVMGKMIEQQERKNSEGAPSDKPSESEEDDGDPGPSKRK